MKNKSLEGQLEGLNSFYSERREYQNKITSLEEVIDELNKKLGSNTDKSKEKEIAITNINTKLNKIKPRSYQWSIVTMWNCGQKSTLHHFSSFQFNNWGQTRK